MDEILKNNDRFLRLLSYYLNDFDRAIKEEDIISVQSAGVSKELAFCYLLCAYMGLDPHQKDRKFFNDYFVPSIKMLDVNDYYCDEYFKIVNFNGEKLGDFELTYKTYEPYQGFVRDDYQYFFNGKVLPLIGFFPTTYRYPAVLQNGVEWMTLLPNEINSQKRYIDEAFGKVLTYGLGLGYYVFHVAKKPEVESVTVVDLSKNVIELFEKNILTKFPKYIQDKIKLVNADAFAYQKSLKDGSFDYIYADIWHDAGDGTPLYLQFKKLECHDKKAKYGYWIEDTIKYYL